jgi:hypothetical protein
MTVEYVRIDWPEPDEPRQARRCTTRDCDYTPRVEGECWLCPDCAEKRRREREALREALAGVMACLDNPGLSERERDRARGAALAALRTAQGG